MFKGLSPRAQKLLTTLVQLEAKSNNNDNLLPEHVLLSLLKSADGLGFRVLQYLKIDLAAFQISIQQSLPPCSATLSYGDLPPSRRLKTIIDIAAIEARSLQQNYIGTEHIVLSALREEHSPAAQFIRNYEISSEMLRKAVVAITHSEPSSAQQQENTDSYKQYEKSKSVQSIEQLRSEARTTSTSRQSHSALQEFSTDLTKLAKEGSLDPVFGREKEISRLIQILSRRTKNNPVLVGEPGVGKTAIVEGLAQCIIAERVPKNLHNKRVLTLDLGSVIAGTKYRGEFEDRIKKIIKEINDKKNIILFIDELHTLIGAGGSEGSMDASNMLKPALSRGELQCIGATTTNEYRKYFERDAALERRFQVIKVEEPSEKDTREILNGLKKHYEKYHGVIYEDAAIDLIIKFTKRYITDRSFPDKAIDILDEVGAMKKIAVNTVSPNLADLETQVTCLTEKKTQLVQQQQYEEAAALRDEVVHLRTEIDFMKQFLDYSETGKQVPVTCSDICHVIATITGIPLDNISESETQKLLQMETELHKSIIGQNESIRLISSAIRRSRAGVSSTRRPLGSFIFLGPTGVGKTLLAKTLAKFLFGTEESLVRIDMSDYMEKHNSSRLVGAPPGYIGYEEGGILTERIRKNPYSVVLLDEIEKAHADVFNLLLQILEEGELRDSFGHSVNFRNTVIIMTSNAGVREISNENRLGFTMLTEGIMDYEEIKSNALGELKRLLNPELLNRIDDIIVFNALQTQEIEAILNIQLAELAERLAEKHLSFQVRPCACEYLAKKGYDPHFGARPMRRLIQREIEDPLAIKLLEGIPAEQNHIIIDFKNEKLLIQIKKSKPHKKCEPTLV